MGAGSVGATIAYACMVRGVGKHISLFDRARAKVEAEVLDLNHGLMFVPMAKLDGSDDIAVLEHSDVIVVTAGAKQKPGQTRIDLAETNTAICRQLIPDLLRVAPDAKLLMVTNPVDVLTYVALKLSGLDSSKVLGSGTVLDSSRFRFRSRNAARWPYRTCMPTLPANMAKARFLSGPAPASVMCPCKVGACPAAGR